METSFAQHYTKFAGFGFPLIPADLKISITRYLDCKEVRISQFTHNTPGDDWVYGFSKTPRIICESKCKYKKKVAHTSQPKISTITWTVLKKVWLVTSRIYNHDETNLTDEPGTKNVISKKGSKYVEQICNYSKSAISLMFCENAERYLIPAYVVYKAKSL
ncbi:Hypothetical protein CINCED_3A000642 [Cinara cedri]|uniref:Uncharacterized protein n=1 Tax=Cinara cedri TaxID=506608 RepID=A0A5E4MUD5_9HEMI|nr:Hypothetical protein CINCED_3A000642 [Cinara cedri]